MGPDKVNLPMGLEPIDLATILAGLALFCIMLAIWGATTVRVPGAGRIKALQERREQLKAGVTTIRKRSAVAGRKKQATSAMRDVLSKMQVLQAEQTKQAQTKLLQAGIRSKDAVITYLFAQLVLPFIIGAVAALCVYGFGMLEAQKPLVRLMAVAGAVILAYKAPEIFVKNAVQKRTDAIRKGLPDALDLLVICAEAGLTVDAAFNRVSKELWGAYPELADEFALTAIELGFLQDRKTAYDNLAKRVDLQALRGVVTTLVQTEKYGTPLASSLRVLSAEFRNERMMKAEEKAARLPAIMTVPLILFILPTLFVVILGPAACRIQDEFINR
jgi:tight adherence protein C